jgi:hypothetical protein
MKTIKLAVFGNRKLTSDQAASISQSLQTLVEVADFVLLSGGADGVSRIAEAVFEGNNLPSVVFKPWNIIWNKLSFDPILFYLRNKQIIENADKVLIFDTGERDSEVHRVVALCERKEKDFRIEVV